MTTRRPFTDLVSGQECTLILEPGQMPRVEHPDCVVPAEVAVDLDAFYCRFCQWNGRVSGAWVMAMKAGRG